MKSIRTTVWDGVATATDHDGNTVKVSTFDCDYEAGHHRAALELCKKMAWSGVLQGGQTYTGSQPAMVWVWEDTNYRLELPEPRRCWLMKGQMEVACTKHGKPSYRWAPAWRIVDAEGARTWPCPTSLARVRLPRTSTPRHGA